MSHGSLDVKSEVEKALTHNITKLPKTKFIEFSYSSKDAFSRFESIKEANDIIKNAVRKTGGDMPRDLVDAYEGLNNVMEHIKDIEMKIIKVGR